jgi:hypothetical protein
MFLSFLETIGLVSRFGFFFGNSFFRGGGSIIFFKNKTGPKL